MKIAKTKLKQIIKEEIRKLYEGFQKKGEEGVVVDLYEFANLIQDPPELTISGTEIVKNPAAVSGVEKGPGKIEVPISLTLTLTEESPVEMLRFSDKVFVPKNLFDQPVAIKHPAFSKYSFVVNL